MNLRMPFEVWGEHITVALPGARALFTTRRGGVSTGPYASLNLGRLTDDDPQAVTRNRLEVEAMAERPLVVNRQVHGARVRRLEQPPGPGEPVLEADGQATATPSVAPMVLVADCLPIVVAGDGAVAIVHAGWRGLAGGVLAQGLDALRELGARAPLHAAIGPGAGPCCYEVGEEVHSAFAAYAPAARHGQNLDLGAVARAQLLELGVEVVDDVGLCTICSDPELFFSHRREAGVTGRQAGVAWLS